MRGDFISDRARRLGGRRLAGLRSGAAVVAVMVLLTGAGGALGLTSVLHILHEPESRELVLEFGSFDLPANAGHHDLPQPSPETAPLPVGGWLRGYVVELADRDGEAVPLSTLHHVNVIAPDRRELFSQIMLRVAAAGRETGEVMLPRVLGYPVGAGERLMVAAMLHNPTDLAYEGVRLRVRMRYTPERRWLRPVAVTPVYLDVMPPASVHAFDLPPGRSEHSWEGSPAVRGRLLGVGGHLHRYGVKLRLEDVTRDRVLWEAEPILNEAGDLIGMPQTTFLWRLGLPLRPDRIYRLRAIYENPTDSVIPLGGMGALGGIFRPARGAMPPPADTTHPEYQLDVRLVTEGGYEHAGQGGHDHHH